MLLAVWLGVATGLGVALRNAGPPWRVALGSLIWPAIPAIAAVSKINHTLKRRRQACSSAS